MIRSDFRDEIEPENCKTNKQKKKKHFFVFWHIVDFDFVSLLHTTCLILAKSAHTTSIVGSFKYSQCIFTSQDFLIINKAMLQ